MQVGDRMVTMIETVHIPAETVVTLESILQEKIAVVRYDFDKNDGKFTSIPVDFLRPANQEEIDAVPYKKLVDKDLWIDSTWRSYGKFKLCGEFNAVVKIIDVSLQTNSKKDLITITLLKCESKINKVYASVILDRCIFYNHEIENSLLEEITSTGEYIFLRPGQRVLHNKKVVTIIDIDEEKNYVRYCSDFENSLFDETNIESLKNLNADNLYDVDYTKIVNKQVRIGYKFKAKTEITLSNNDDEENTIIEAIEAGNQIEILTVKTLSSYALEDKFIISFKDHKVELNTYNILTNFVKL